MAITMQGNWTVRVRGRNAAYAQRFIIHGADSGNGIHDGVVGQHLFVTGSQWTLQVQHRPTRKSWRDSRQRLGSPVVEDGLLRLTLSSNDGGLDEDFDDLVIECSLPVSSAEHVVYGRATRHDGSLPFNPWRDDYLVLDAPVDVAAVCLRYPTLAPVIDRLYPGRAGAPLASPPTELSPWLIPNSLPPVAVGLRFESRAVDVDTFWADQGGAVEALQASVSKVPCPTVGMKAGRDLLSPADQRAIDLVCDAAIQQVCEPTPAPGVALTFQRYHRSAAEVAGGPYRGNGLREELGVALTDEQGHYVFRFRHHRADEQPDLIVQVAAAGRMPGFETAPYDGVANLRRLDLCVPARVGDSATRPGGGETESCPAAGAAIFEYVGTTSLTVIGAASGRCYRFGGPGVALRIEACDHGSLDLIRSLKRCAAA